MNLKEFVQKWIVKNFPLKILAFIIAIILWFVVMHVDNYIVTKTIRGIPVETINGEAIEETGNLYAIIDGDTVDIIVKGERAIVDELTADDFVATADLSKLSLTNTAQISVKTKVAKKGEGLSITYLNEFVSLSIEPMEESNVSISIYPEGEVMDGFALGNMVATPNLVTVTGPKSLIDKIDTVRAVVSVQNKSESFESNAELVCLDSSGNAMTSKQLKLSSDTVDVSVSVYPEKTVKVNVSTIGMVADGYSLGEITYNPDTVVIAGDAETLAKIDSIDIDNISVSGLDDDFETNVDVADYLPQDVILADDDNKEIAIKIDITKIVQKVINVTTNDITLKNTDPKMEYRVVIPSTYKLTVSATEDKMKDIAADDLNLFLDVKDLGVGNHEVVIGYDISDDYTVSMNSGATVIVKAGEEESGE